MENGIWQKFFQVGNERVGIFGECAGICKLEPKERQRINQLELGSEEGKA